MSRYIDAEALKEKFTNANADGINLAIDKYALKCIEDTPSIDIVRCKECKWGKPYSDKQLECDALGLGGLKFPDDFCNYGERE